MFLPRILFDDGHYMLELTWLGLGALYASTPTVNVRASKLQRWIFLKVCDGFTAAGGVLSPDDERCKVLMKDFCTMILNYPIGSPAWRMVLDCGPDYWGSRYAQ